MTPKYCEARRGQDVCCLRAHHVGLHSSWKTEGGEAIRDRWADGSESETIPPEVKTDRGGLVVEPRAHK